MLTVLCALQPFRIACRSQLNILASLLFEPVATCAEDAACILEGCGDVLVRDGESPPLLGGMVDQRMGAKTSSERPPPLAHVEPLALQELPDGMTANQGVVVLP